MRLARRCSSAILPDGALVNSSCFVLLFSPELARAPLPADP